MVNSNKIATFGFLFCLIMYQSKLNGMKLRILICTIILAFIFIPGNAQFKFGIRGGINSAYVKPRDFNNPDYLLEYKSGDLGFHFGAMAQLKLGRFFVEPEILFSTASTDIQLTDLNDPQTTRKVGEQKFNKLDVPIIAGMKMGPMRLQLGPVATVQLNSKSDLLKENGIEQAYKGMTIGYQAGVGLQLSGLLLDLKYEGNLSKFGDGVNIGSQTFNFDQRMSQVILSIGFLF